MQKELKIVIVNNYNVSIESQKFESGVNIRPCISD
jgi:hypothetical protein